MEKKNKMNLSTKIVICILVILIIMGGVYIGFFMNKENNKIVNPSNDPSNVVNNEEGKGIKLDFTKETYPKIDGATAMRPMSVEIAKSVLNMTDLEAEEFIIHNTTAKAYENLINKTADLIFVSEPSDGILNDAKQAGVEFEMVGIGRDGFVFIINQENPVESLTIEQIQNIYTGKITNWREVGGVDAKILAYQREPNSGSQNLMEKMVMKDLEFVEAPTELVIESMAGLVDRVASYNNSKNSIGYSIYLYAKEQYVKDNIKFLSINGVYPTDDTIADGTYPLSKIVYAIYRKDEPQDSNVRKLVEWLKTEEGQKTVIAGGYTGIK
ncbi:MAG: hypothetical protein E7311_00055 [Clostridiales bacterium]|nr:hypothetical protein [Clostridiales bacterium]